MKLIKIPKNWRRLKNGETIKKSDRYKWVSEDWSKISKPDKISIGEKFFHGGLTGWNGHFYRKVKNEISNKK